MAQNIKLLAFIAVTGILSSCNIQKNTTRINDNNSQIIIQSTLIPSDKMEIDGVLEDLETGEPLPFATIKYTDSQGNYRGQITDENGHFTFTDLPGGSGWISIQIVGYVDNEFGINLEGSNRHTMRIKLYQKPIQVEKPVIYIYPTQQQKVEVDLLYDGQLLHSYPSYPNTGWTVYAEPNGTLHDEKGMEYYALFWEGQPNQEIIPQDGFIIAGKETATFLEEKLDYLGLNRREANEFIMYWLPRMENNPYNLIHFAGSEYTDQAELLIQPQPETTIRVMMITQALETNIQFPLQDLSSLKKSRQGFTVVEWGGSITRSVPVDF